MNQTNVNQIISQISKTFSGDYSLLAYADLRDSSSTGALNALQSFYANFQKSIPTDQYLLDGGMFTMEAAWRKNRALVHCVAIAMNKTGDGSFGSSAALILVAYGSTIYLIADSLCDGIITCRGLSSELLCYFRGTEVGAPPWNMPVDALPLLGIAVC
jgi:hypothetical protein